MNRICCTGVLLFCLLLCACSQRIYVPPLLNNDISYQFKPMSSDSAKKSSYISGTLILGYAAAGIDDRLTIGQLNYSRALTFKNFNIAYGAYGFGGAYDNNTYITSNSYYFSSKSFLGLGARFSANYFTTSGNTDERFIGVEISYSKEFGDFLGYRRTIKNQPDFKSDDQSNLFTMGLTNEIITHNSNHSSLQYGARIFYGHTFNPTDLNNYNLFGVINSIYISYFAKFGNFCGVIDIGPSSQFTLGYKF